MDTSNNQECITDQDLALSYIFGLANRRITPAMLTPETWIQVVYHVLSLCSESLRYFHSMTEARHLVEKLCDGFKGIKVHFHSDTLAENKRAHIVCDLGSTKERLRYVSRKLLLTDDADLVESVMESTAHVSEVYGEEGKVIWDSWNMTFIKIDNARFLQLLDEKQGLVVLICLSIKKLLDRSVERREEQLAALRQTRDAVHRASLVITAA